MSSFESSFLLGALIERHCVHSIVQVLKLGIGARVMLRRNLDQSKGLINGACGVVEELLSEHDGVVSKVVVRFPHLPRPVPLVRVRADFEIGSNLFQRMLQFPVVLSWGVTIHKVRLLGYRKSSNKPPGGLLFQPLENEENFEFLDIKS